MKVLAISGSLKPDSTNSAILKAVAALAPEALTFTFYHGLGDLPHFSPDKDNDLYDSVRNLREQLKQADAIIISTPEYAFGVPGTLKNALDWSVSSGEFNEKAVGVISASPLPSGGDKAHASLLLTLTALGARVPERAKLTIPNVKKKIEANGTIVDDTLRDEFILLIQSLEDMLGTPVSYTSN